MCVCVLGFLWLKRLGIPKARHMAPKAKLAWRAVRFQPVVGPTAVADDEALERPTVVGRTAVADEDAPERPRVVRDWDDEALERPTAVADCADSDSDAAAHSIAGDTADSETDGGADSIPAERSRIQPQSRIQGTPGHRSSKYNSEPEVGNFGLFLGNWGLRGTVGGQAAQKLRREVQDRQILKSPAQVLVVLEASRQVEDLLKQPPVQGNLDQEGLQRRSTRDYFVVRGEEQSAILVAARQDNTTSLECLHHEVHDDHAYREKGKQKMARSRMIVCSVSFKQNIGHLGKDIVVCGAHGNYRTMKIEWPQEWRAFWDRLAQYVTRFGIQFLAGDFNMSFTEVPKQLRSRGIICDCVAWYPWQKARVMETAAVAGDHTLGQRLGFDSCGIFYIGGCVQVSTPWSLQHIPILAAVAGDQEDLDVYQGENVPGQPWHCYRSKAHQETPADKNLMARLRDLLTLSTTTDELQSIPPRAGVCYCAYLRLKQKPMDRREWLVEGNMHNGAHFPLCVFTCNARARSQEAEQERARKRNSKKGSCSTNKGKGKGPLPVPSSSGSDWGWYGSVWQS
jgi:hypothetical protein